MESTLQRIQFWLLVALGVLASFNYNSIKLLRDELKVVRQEILSMEEQISLLQRRTQTPSPPVQEN